MPTRGVQVVIFNEERSQVLLIKREDFRVWTIPGGRAERGETLEETGCREVLERLATLLRSSDSWANIGAHSSLRAAP